MVVTAELREGFEAAIGAVDGELGVGFFVEVLQSDQCPILEALKINVECFT